MTQPPTPDPSPPAHDGERPGGDPHLDTAGLQGDLRGRSVRGGAVMLFAQGSKLVLNVGAIAILARLLTPTDFGLFAMVTAITGFLMHLKDLGLSGATVQKAEVSHAQVSTLFWINLVFGAVLAIVVAACAPLIGWFYGEPRLNAMTIALAASFLITGLAVQHRALLKRRMRFTALAVTDLVSVLIGIIAGVAAALGGLSYWALVIRQLAMTAGLAAVLWLACGWRPGRPARAAGVRSMLAFGGNLTGANLLVAATRQFDKLLLGWRWGAVSLGYYSKAYQLLLLPVQQINQPLSNVAIPTLSRLQDDPPRFVSFYRHGLQIMAALGMPTAVFLFAAAEHVVLTVLGEQWRDTVPIFHRLAPAAFVGSFGIATTWLYVALGQTGRQLRWAVFSSLVIAVGLLIGLRWGALGVAAAFSITLCGLCVPGIMYCVRTMPVTLGDIFGVLWRPAIAAVVGGLVLFVFNHFSPLGGPPIVSLAVDFVVYLAAYGGCWVVLPDGPRIMRDVFSLVSLLRQRGAEADPPSGTRESS